MIAYRTLIVDLDGTLFVDMEPIPGALQALRRLRGAGLTLRFATNTTRMSSHQLRARLTRIGLGDLVREITTAPMAAGRALLSLGHDTVLPLLPRRTWADLEGLRIMPTGPTADAPHGSPSAVLVGDLGRSWSDDRLNEAFLAVRAGAKLYACHKNRYWHTAGQLRIDAGAYVAALEYATGVHAQVIGKPAPEFFWSILQGDERDAPDAVLVVGDDISSDVAGAAGAGFRSALVQTGKYRAEDLEQAATRPDHVIASIAELPALLGVGGP